MKNIFLLISLLIILTSSAFADEPSSTHELIASKVAVSQTGHFSIEYSTPLIIDADASANLINFMAFKESNLGNKIIIGAIPAKEELISLCQHPQFLKEESISNVTAINEGDIKYFTTKQYKGCIIPINIQQAAVIITLPKPFINQEGQQIKHVAIIANKDEIIKLQSNLYFQVKAEDFFINLVQLSQAFSPFSKEINWTDIKEQGLAFIGKETQTCRGLSAASKFLTPALHNIDLHSNVSQNGLDTSMCPSTPLTKDKDMQQWLSLPETTRNKIVNYSGNFHGNIIDKLTYLYVPAIDAYDPVIINKKITEGREDLKNANINKSCGLIIDLRFNYGGSIAPMLLSVSEMLKTGKLFSTGKNSPVYLSKDRNQLSIGQTGENYGTYDGSIKNQSRNIPVAILTNWMTASSGILTGIALRDNTDKSKVFGTATSPTASVNATFYLLDGNTLNLMVDRVYNNKDQLLPLRLSPDVVIEDNLETIFDANKDETLAAARQWLESQPECKN